MLLCHSPVSERLGGGCPSPRLCGGGTEAPPCREVSAAIRQEPLLNRLLSPGSPPGSRWPRCYLCAAAHSGIPRRSYKNECLNVKPAAWGFVATFSRRSNVSLNVSIVLTKTALLLPT